MLYRSCITNDTIGSSARRRLAGTLFAQTDDLVADAMDLESSVDLSRAISPDAAPTTEAVDVVLAPPVPAEVLSGSDPGVLLPDAADMPPGTEVIVPSLADVTAAEDCLAGGGEMAALMRSFDWSQSSIGPITSWPPSLCAAVSIMLASGFPMLIVWGPEYIQLYNDAYRPVLGATKHPAALGQRARDGWPEIWDTMLAPLFQQVMATGEPFRSEDRLFVLDRNGYVEETYFTFSYSAIRDATGRPGGVLVTCVETTERVLSERRLRTLRELAAHASSAETISDACRIVAETMAANPNDLPFTLLYFIDEDRRRADLCASSGVARGTAASPETLDLAAPDGVVEHNDVWPIATVAQNDRSEMITDLRSRAGTLPGGPWPESADAAIAIPIKHVGKQAPPSAVFVAGISPRRAFDASYRGFLDLVAAQISTALSNARVHEVGRRRADTLAELDRAKTAFFSNVSHELRTPLMLMLGPANDLLAGDHGILSTAQREPVQLLRRNAARLLRMVNALLDFSQIEAGRADASFEATDLAAFTSDLASAFRSAVERAGLTLTVDCPPLDEPVYVDRHMWEKIVLNLLSNALKFTFDGRIDVVLRAINQYVELVVSDTGTGVAPIDIRYLFSHFHRVRGARARSTEGAGMGLALVHELARIHGGSVNVVSEPGRGSSFSVCLLKGQAHLPADRVRRSRALTSPVSGAEPFVDEAMRWLDETAAEEIGVTAAGAAQPARVLIADDHVDMRQYLTRLLRPRWIVETVADGLAALDAVRARRPDLIVADVMMPGLDGVALLRALRADAATATIPVLLLSARAGEEAKVEGLEAGAADYLVKPFSARELLAKVQSQIELSGRGRA